MGNTKSTSCSNKTSVTEEDLNLTDYDMTIYEYRKQRIFKGTIAICIVYAFIALLIIVTSYLFPSIKYVIFDKFLPFTIVFIVGTILIILYLYYNILNFKPIKINKNYDYTNISCPDYWTLEYNSNLQNYFDSNTINPEIFNYRCVLNSNIFSKTALYFNKKNQLGFADNDSNTSNSDAIGLTGTSTTNKGDNLGVAYNDITADTYDNNNDVYMIADIKNTKNKEIIDKIAGNYDSNIYKNLVESSLLMNNYYKVNKGMPEYNSNNYDVYSPILYPTGNQTEAIDLLNKNNFKEENGVNYNLISTNTIPNDLKIKPVIFDTTKTESGSSKSLFGNTLNPFVIKKNISNEDYLTNVKTSAAGFATTAVGTPSDLNKFPIVCNRLYPLLLAAKDKELSKNSKGKYDENVLRCSYSKMCGIPWSDMNCDKYNI
jgi:hypothetical protein